MTAAKTTLPVLGVPVQSKTLNGLDSLLSIVQMPAGVPVATFAIGAAGATNAALFAAAILANKHAAHRRRAGEISARSRPTACSQQSRSARDTEPLMTIGIVGAGQLGRMLALAGYPLGLDFLFLDPAAGRARRARSRRRFVGELHRSAAARASSHGACEVLTFDWENISVDGAARAAARHARSARRSRRSPHRRTGCSEKQLFERLKIPTTRWQRGRFAARSSKRAVRSRSACPAC